jgi:hypothetical protein
MKEMETSDAREIDEEKKAVLIEKEVERQKEREDEGNRLEIEKAALLKDEEDAQNPDLTSFFVIFSGDVARQVYRFHLPKENATLLELKVAISNEFGYAMSQQHIYFKKRLLKDEDLLIQLPGWTDGCVLRFFPIGRPAAQPEFSGRPMQPEDRIVELRASRPGVGALWLDRLRAASTEITQFAVHKEFIQNVREGCISIMHGEVKPVAVNELLGNGGSKYYYKDIVFRSALHWEALGEDSGDGDFAFKICGNELRALENLQGKIQNLRIPMACIVDYFGARFLATSSLPVDHDTLVYGSSTDGLTIERNSDADGMAEKIAEVFHLKEHAVKEGISGRAVRLRLPFTTQLHKRVDDDDFVVVSTHRLLPSDIPEGKKIDRVRLLSQTFRPEFLAHYLESAEDYVERVVDVAGEKLQVWQKVGGENDDEYALENPGAPYLLNPDASIEAEDSEDHQGLKKASLHLREVVILKFMRDVDDLVVDVHSGGDLRDEMHSRGINMRYLGRIMSQTSLRHVREVCLREVLARSIKTLIRDGLGMMFEVDRNPIHLFVEYVNKIFGGDVPSENTLEMWRLISKLSFEKFGVQVDVSLKSRMYLPALVHSVASKLNFKLKRYAGFDFAADTPFSVDDVDMHEPMIKGGSFPLSTVDALVSEATRLDAMGKRSIWFHKGGPEREQATEQYRGALRTAEEVYGKEDLRLTEMYLSFANHLESRHSEEGRPEYSEWNRCMFVPKDALSEEAEFYYQKVLDVCEANNEKVNSFISEAHLGLARVSKETVPEGFQDLSDEEQAIEYAPCQHILTAVETREALYGFEHPEMSEVYSIAALMFSEANDPQRASQFIRKAFVVTMVLYGPDHDETRDMHKIFSKIEVKCASGLADIAIEELPQHIQDQAFPEEDDAFVGRLDRGFVGAPPLRQIAY